MPPVPPPPPTTRRALLLALGAVATSRASAQPAAFPSRPISLQVPFGPGGIADLTARAVATAMQASLGQTIVVENKLGAGSIVASQAVLSAAPDGHTLLLMSNGHAVAPGQVKRLPYDATRDFAPVIRLARFELGLFVASGARHRQLADWLAEAAARPGKLTIGTVSIGSTQHLAAELFRHLAGIEVLVVPYKATPAVLTALRAGEIDLGIEILGPWLPQLKAGALRVLATTDAQRHPALPDVPTVQQAGGAALKSYDVASWNGLAAPARTPPEVIATLNRAANAALQQPAVRQAFESLGVRPLGGAPEELRTLLVAETRHWAEVMRRAGIEPQ